jgi:hypothetical protein
MGSQGKEIGIDSARISDTTIRSQMTLNCDLMSGLISNLPSQVSEKRQYQSHAK